ncbi:UDP-2,4-diacetamido-2,4,6-trideoxy-beta-L-altropyranose hydrolase [Luminiphilus sp.]|nr:UDP-2,4-diacetamido-2,4,6-trideoxy-beta-L-altropyranose hydrolase [Luminiphilus sp.]
MKFVFRTDASLLIGTGHVMRCLAFADLLLSRGAECVFICREHEGNLIGHIRRKGHLVHSLPVLGDTDTSLGHSSWLGATQTQDVRACVSLLSEIQPDWLVVDHYAIDAYWESSVEKHCGHLLVIDDLADRSHHCSVLVDQTHDRNVADYYPFVPKECHLLCGASYALLRPEFAELRSYSLQRRARPELKRLLISMGGVDRGNVTAEVLTALRDSPLPRDCEITVVLGETAPWRADVERKAEGMRWPVTLLQAVTNMAELLADSDLAIGASGSATWERCCMGLPSVMVVLAENQNRIAEAVEAAGAGVRLDASRLSLLRHMPLITGDQVKLRSMSKAASAICDGTGAAEIAARIMRCSYEDSVALQ